MSGARRVIKLGGSLLDWPELHGAFDRWLAEQPQAASVVIVGGGAIVEALRALDRAHSLGEEAAHWLAIQGMSVTAALAAQRLSTAIVTDVDELIAGDADHTQILDVHRFMRTDAAGADPLPCSWDVTSDSIAARVAVRLEARELVLLKSNLPSEGMTRQALASSGFVDHYFPIAAERLVVRVVNLRGESFPQATI